MPCSHWAPLDTVIFALARQRMAWSALPGISLALIRLPAWEARIFKKKWAELSVEQ